MIKTIFTAKDIRGIYPKMDQYFGFEYIDIHVELNRAMNDDFENHTLFLETSNINHLPDDYEIPLFFHVKENISIEEINEFHNKYEFIRNNYYMYNLFCLLIIFVQNRCISFYGIESGNEIDYIFAYSDKRKLYEFLLDNFKEYNFNYLPKAQIILSYGLDSQITIDNHNNWLYYLLKTRLYNSLTFEGKFEYERMQKSKRPSNPPKFHNFIAYNLYLLLKDVVGSDKEYPVEFLKFIIDFCQLCDIELIGRQAEVLGMKDLIKGARKQYNNQPIPYSLVR